MRRLIQLSDPFRSRLYDLLEASEAEAFYEGEDHDRNQRAGKAGERFLREQLQKAGLQLNEEAFQMLYVDFMCSHHFYTRRDEYNKRKG